MSGAAFIATVALAALGCATDPGRQATPPRRDPAKRSDDPPNPERIVMMAPITAVERLVVDTKVAPYRPTLPPNYNEPGLVFWGLYKVCVTYEGSVYRVSTIKPATPELDDRWSGTMRNWRYAPYVRDGQPTAFCTPVRIEVRADDVELR
jgi:hypothetical protein